MLSNLDFIPKNSLNGLKHYVKTYNKLINLRLKNFNRSYESLSLREMMGFNKILLLDKRFWNSLTKYELIACKTIAKKEYCEQSLNERKITERIFEKWRRVFFETKSDKLNPIDLGIVLKSLRLLQEISQEKLAYKIGVNRKTVVLIEKGERFPSVDYLFEFSKLFNIKIDEILSYCI